MAVQPDTDQRLSAASGRLAGNGARFLALAATLYLIGAILLLASVSWVAGLMCIGLGTPPAIAGVGLVLSGGAGKRFAKHKDWA